MNINQTNPVFQARMPKKLVPISEYKGPILQLKQTEQKEIFQLQEKIKQSEMDLENLRKEMKKKRPYSNACAEYFNGQVKALKDKIKLLTQKISDIKINRFNEQKKALGIIQ